MLKLESNIMTRWKNVSVATMVACAAFAIVVVHAQTKKSLWSLEFGSLTPQDYIEIQQLVARYPYALDRGTRHGKDYAALFTTDGVFEGNGKLLKGRDALAKSADRGDDAPQNVGHFMVNHIIEPGPTGGAGGAVGQQYLLTISAIGPEENGRRAASIRQWHYEDVYEKTSEGWLFKSRTLIPRPQGRPPAPQATPSR
jgi:hypothetical protein